MSALPSKSNDRPQRPISAKRPNADERLGLPVVSGETYAPFGAWLDGELDILIDRWKHLAGPRAALLRTRGGLTMP